mmetsp:Transcript_28116/g.39542  ORF Transcript_28116/g.39542 Transcript_28116/m.39542 type:complete len:458 (-) Transcript_28116:375-1748(-)
MILHRNLLLLTTTFLGSAKAFHHLALRRNPYSIPSSQSSVLIARQVASPSVEVDDPASNTQSTKKEDDNDNLFKFSTDIKRVLHDLRGSTVDPTIPKRLRQSSTSNTYSKIWTLEDWEQHNSRKRYLRYIINFPRSRLLRRIAPQQAALMMWTFCSVWIEDHFFKKQPVPLASLGMISTFLAFLLTLRSNQGLSRLDEARRAWSKVVLYTREMSSLISSFVYPVDKQLGLLLARHVALFGWLLKSQLRFTPEENVQDIVQTMLPNKKDSEYVLSQRQRTVAVVTRIRQVIHHLGKKHKLSTAEEIALDHTAQILSDIITSTGRLRASPIPTLYTSHSSRLLVFYLMCLPPALHLSGLSGLVTMIVTMSVGFAMLGLDEISHIFEQPFRVIPMYQISKRSMLAVADSMTCRPPPLYSDDTGDDVEEFSQKELTTYWTKDTGVENKSTARDFLRSEQMM